MSSTPISETNVAIKQPSEYSRALTLKRKIDLAIRDKEVEQMSHNIRAIADGRESRKSYLKDVGRKALTGSVAGAMAGGVAAIPITLAKQPFRRLRHKPLGMMAVGGATALGGLGFGIKRLREGRKNITPSRYNPDLVKLRHVREELKNPESPVYKSLVLKTAKLKKKKIISDTTDVATAGVLSGAAGSVAAGAYSLKKAPISDPYYTPHLSDSAQKQ